MPDDPCSPLHPAENNSQHHTKNYRAYLFHDFSLLRFLMFLFPLTVILGFHPSFRSNLFPVTIQNGQAACNLSSTFRSARTNIGNNVDPKLYHFYLHSLNPSLPLSEIFVHSGYFSAALSFGASVLVTSQMDSFVFSFHL